jgi:hypothetical protein
MKLFLPVLFLIFGILTGCVDRYDAPCRDQVITKVYTFSAAQASVIPYSKTDTLVYAAGLNDTLYLKTSSYTDSALVFMTNQPNNPECPNDFESHQILQCILSDSLLAFHIDYNVYQLEAFATYSNGSDRLEVGLSAIGAQDSTYLDSVQLGNTMFYGVNTFTNSFLYSPIIGHTAGKKGQ